MSATRDGRRDCPKIYQTRCERAFVFVMGGATDHPWLALAMPVMQVFTFRITIVTRTLAFEPRRSSRVSFG